MEETVRYTYRLRPGAGAVDALISEWHRTRYLWNEAVARMRSGERLSFGLLSKDLTARRAEHGWLRAGSQVAQQQELRAFAQALDQSFKVKDRRRPAFKSARRTRPSVGYTKRNFLLREGRLILPKGVSIPVVWSRDLPSEPTSVRVYRDSLGHWYASFVVRREIETAPAVSGGIGIDWGVSTTATTTDPDYDLPHSGNRRKVAAQMAAAQRRMARRHRPGRPQSNGYKRAKRSAAKVAKTAQRRNTHAARVWSRKVVANHQTIAVEDFHPKFLAKSTMARKASDAAVSTVKRTLIEYAERAGRKVVLVEPAYTTMTCHGCWTTRAKRLALSDRVFVCEACGLVEDRDRNAARTILAVAERGHASVEGVRHSVPPSEVSGAA